MKLYKTILKIGKLINRDNIFVYASQAAFYIIISSIPFMMLMLSLLQHIFPVSEEEVSDILTRLLPDAINSPVGIIISEIFHKTSLPIISITAISSLWSASRGIAATERGIRNVYKSPMRKNFLLNTLFSIVYTVIFIITFAVFLLMFVFGNFILKLLSPDSMTIYRIINNSGILKQALTLIIFSIFFAIVYAVFSGKKIRVRRHIPGGVFTTSVWILFSELYSFYINNFANHSYIYGSLTAIVLLMLWIYFCMLIFLLGAEVNVLILANKLNGQNQSSSALETKRT